MFWLTFSYVDEVIAPIRHPSKATDETQIRPIPPLQLQLRAVLDRGDSAAAERIIAAPGFNVNEQDWVSSLALTCV